MDVCLRMKKKEEKAKIEEPSEEFERFKAFARAVMGVPLKEV